MGRRGEASAAPPRRIRRELCVQLLLLSLGLKSEKARHDSPQKLASTTPELCCSSYGSIEACCCTSGTWGLKACQCDTTWDLGILLMPTRSTYLAPKKLKSLPLSFFLFFFHAAFLSLSLSLSVSLCLQNHCIRLKPFNIRNMQTFKKPAGQTMKSPPKPSAKLRALNSASRRACWFAARRSTLRAQIACTLKGFRNLAVGESRHLVRGTARVKVH